MAETTDRRDVMQRVRIGLTGLAGVLVLVLFAAALLGLRSRDAGLPAGHGGVPGSEGAQARASDPKDPLAELGVTPGGSGGGEAPAHAAAVQPRQDLPPAPTVPVAGNTTSDR